MITPKFLIPAWFLCCQTAGIYFMTVDILTRNGRGQAKPILSKMDKKPVLDSDSGIKYLSTGEPSCRIINIHSSNKKLVIKI